MLDLEVIRERLKDGPFNEAVIPPPRGYAYVSRQLRSDIPALIEEIERLRDGIRILANDAIGFADIMANGDKHVFKQRIATLAADVLKGTP